MELYPWQREAIDELVTGSGKVLVVAPTGGGKSMVFQQPAVDLDGIALVITPLVSLMADQVAGLTERGIPATYLAANLSAEENRSRMERAMRGDVKLLYVAPERLASERFVQELEQLKLSLLAVDEAHCISHWGHDFRPDYLQLGDLVARLNPPRLLACTATATPAVRKEIVERLHMPEAHQVLRGFARDNLELAVEEVSGPRAKEHRTIAEVKRVLVKPRAGNGTVIVYTGTRRQAEEAAEALRGAGWRADHYHAGMDGPSRTAVQEKFLQGTLDVVTATNAFGMGIDRPDIRLVVHLTLPDSVEAYYQEVGRAGRDGEPAEGLLLLSDPDIAWRFKLIGGDPALAPEYAMHRRELFRALIGYAETSGCRHDTILRYFEDEAEVLGGCGHCDNCRARAAGRIGVEPSAEESAPTVRKTIEAIRGLPFSVGMGTLAAYLLGNPNAQVKRHFWHQRPQFGLLGDRSEDWIRRMLRRMIAAGMIAIDPEHDTLKVTRRAADVEFGRRENTVILPPSGIGGVAGTTRSGRSAKAREKAPPPTEGQLDAHAISLYARLRDWRTEVAVKQDVPAYVVTDDSSLRSIAHIQPRDEAALLTAYGIGPGRVEKYGAAILDIVRRHLEGAGARDVEAAAAVDAAAQDAPRSYNEERKAEARKIHPRAFEPWTQGEDDRLRAGLQSGESLEQLVAALERQPGAIRIRTNRFGLEDQLWSAEEDARIRERVAAGDDAAAIAAALERPLAAVEARLSSKALLAVAG